MRYFITVFFLLITILLIGQDSGRITYAISEKLDIDIDENMMPGIDLKALIPSSRSSIMTLSFNPEQSIYASTDQEDVADSEMESDDGSVKMTISYGDEIPEKLYTDLLSKETIHQQGFMNRAFRVSSEQIPYKWKVTTEKIKYLDYECIKATTVNKDDEIVVAWFTPQIPSSIGPAGFHGLPGAILMASVGETKKEIKATQISIGDLDLPIVVPSEGQLMSQEEFEKVVTDKRKEMESSNGGSYLIIRN